MEEQNKQAAEILDTHHTFSPVWLLRADIPEQKHDSNVNTEVTDCDFVGYKRSSIPN